MKRFLLFMGDTYYPAGGWDDFKGDYDTELEAVLASKERYKKYSYDWDQIIDTDDPNTIKHSD